MSERDQVPMQLPLFAEFSEQDAELATKEYLSTGKIACKDHQRVEAVIEDVLRGMSISAICRKHGVRWGTVMVIRARAEAEGKLEGVKARLGRQFAGLAEMALDAMAQRIQDGTLPPVCLGPAMGIAAEKYLLMTGQATVISEQKGPAAAEAAEAWLARFRAARQPATIDVASVVLEPNQGGNGGLCPLACPEPGATGRSPAPGEGAGGGSVAGETDGNDEGSTPAKSTPTKGVEDEHQ